MLNQIPEFEELEYIIGYSPNVGYSGEGYAGWSDRAKEWLETQRRNSVVTNVHPLAEGAD